MKVIAIVLFSLVLNSCMDVKADIPDSVRAKILQAVMSDNLDQVESLVNRFPEVLQQGSLIIGTKELIPLHEATYKNNEALVDFLVSRGAPINQQLKVGTTALHIAARYGYDEIVKLLLKRGADPNLRDSTGAIPLATALSFGHDRTALILLRVSDTQSRNNRGITMLGLAIAYKDVESISELLNEKSLINIPDDFGYTPLIIASALGNLDAMKLLLIHGADKNIKDLKGKTAYDSALISKATEIRGLLDQYP